MTPERLAELTHVVKYTPKPYKYLGEELLAYIRELEAERDAMRECVEVLRSCKTYFESEDDSSMQNPADFYDEAKEATMQFFAKLKEVQG